jgi:hypothetical protein
MIYTLPIQRTGSHPRPVHHSQLHHRNCIPVPMRKILLWLMRLLTWILQHSVTPSKIRLGKRRDLGTIGQLQQMIPSPAQPKTSTLATQTPKREDEMSRRTTAEMCQPFVRHPDLIYYETKPEWRRHYKEFDEIRREFTTQKMAKQRSLTHRNKPLTRIATSPHKGQADTERRMLNKGLDAEEAKLLEEFRAKHFGDLPDDVADWDPLMTADSLPVTPKKQRAQSHIVSPNNATCPRTPVSTRLVSTRLSRSDFS